MRSFPIRYIVLILFILTTQPVSAGFFGKKAETIDPRISRAEAELKEAQDAMQDATNAARRVVLEQRVDLAMRELANAKRAVQLEEEEQNLASRRKARAEFRLREAIGDINTNTNNPLAEVQQNNLVIRGLKDSRSILTKLQKKQLENTEASSLAIELTKMRIGNVETELLTRTLKRDAAELALRLARETLRAEAFRRDLELNPQPTVRRIYQKKQDLDLVGKKSEEFRLMQGNLRALIDETQTALALAKERLNYYENQERILRDLVEKPSDREEREHSKAQLRHVENIVSVVGERVRLVEEQVEALKASLDLAERGHRLFEAESVFRTNDLVSLRGRYIHRVTVPILIVVILIFAYALISRFAFPLLMQADSLFVARRLGGYVLAFVVLIVLVSFFLEDLKAIATVMGIVGAAVVIALQDLCSSFAGWFVIVTSRKVKVGDRVEIEGHRGDIIDIQMLRTTLLELNNWLGVDEPTGRVVVVPNSFIFKSQVFNYSHVHPSIWGKVDITVTFETPAAKAYETLLRVLEEETKDEFEGAQRGGQKLIDKYGLVRISYEPHIHSVIDASGVTFSLFYVSHYRRYSTTRDKLVTRILAEFEKDPELNFAYPTERLIPTPEGGGFPVSMQKTEATDLR